MTKILNLDEISSEEIEKQVVYKGVTHKFQPMTVDELISMVREAEQMESEGDTTPDSTSKRFGVVRDTIAKAYPTLASELGTMTASLMFSIFEFMQRTAGNDVEAAAAEYTKDELGNAEAAEAKTA